MAAKRVDKDSRREELADLAYEVMTEEGIQKFSIDSFIKTLKIGKSSFYNYFKSKDELMFFILQKKTSEYIQTCKKKMSKKFDFRKNLHIIFANYLSDEKENREGIEFFKEFFVTYVTTQNENLKEVDKFYVNQMQAMIKFALENDIEKNLMKKEALEHYESLLMTANGMMFFSFSQKDINLSEQLKKHIDNFINLLEVK